MVTRVGQAVGAAFGKVFGAITGAKGTSEALPGVFNSLHQANRDLRSAGIKLPTLDYEQARDLLWVLDQLTDGQVRVVLILDAFDQGEGVEVEAKTIQSFLRHLDDWPECHMFFATRAPEAGETEAVALKCVKEFDEASIAAEVWPLPVLHLPEDLDESDRLVHYLNDKVPATRDVDRELLMRMIDGYAGVIGRWVDAGQVPRNAEELGLLAEDAHSFRYRDLDGKLSDLKAKNGAHFEFAVRLALLPDLGSTVLYEPFKIVIENERPASPIPDLQACGLLQPPKHDTGAPTYGHAKRHEAIRRIVCTRDSYKPLARKQAEYLITELAPVDPVLEETRPILLALLTLGGVSQDIGVHEEYVGVCAAAATLLGRSVTSVQSRLIGASVQLVSRH